MNYKIDISPSTIALSEQFTQILLYGLKQTDARFTLALSGGSTPKTVFNYMAAEYSSKIDWERIKFFWGDERCVLPTHSDSNYKMTKENLFDKISVPQENIFRIHGEVLPSAEAARYESILSSSVKIENNFPRFDLVMLGLGEDGHTASIFPDQLNLFETDNFCAGVKHPITKQKRITVTGKVINNAKRVIFLVTGKNKSEIVRRIIRKEESYQNIPASLINLYNGELIWLLDKDSGQYL